MGKMRKRNKFHRANPTGIQNMNDFVAEQNDEGYLDSQKGALLGSIEKLQSPVLSVRECGAEGLALVARHKDAIEQLLKNDVVRIAAPLLLDNSPTVRHSIAGSLRNLTAVGGLSVCDHFVQKDVMTPLVQLYKTFYQNWRPKEPTNGKIDSSTEIFIEATNLLWNLCESSEQAVSIFNSQNLLVFLQPCLKVSVFGPRVALVSAQCFQVVTENNVDLLSQFPSDCLKDEVAALLSLEGTEPIQYHLRAVAAGIYLNLHGGKLPGCLPSENSLVLELLSKTLGVSIVNTVRTYKEQEDGLNNADNPEDLILGVKAEGEELAKDNIMTMFSAKQAALEVLTNICCDDDGADEWESLCSSEAGDDTEMPMEEDTPSDMPSVCLPDELQAVLTKLNILELVEEHAIIPDDIITQLASCRSSADILDRLQLMQCHALLCLHNMLAGGLEVTNGVNHIHQLWLRLAQLVLTLAGKGQVDLLEATTGCLRAIVQRLSEQKVTSSVAHLTLSDLNALFGVAQGCPDSKVRVNILRIVATIGLLLECDKSPAPEPLIACIGQFLLEVGLQDDDIWVNAEAADAIMDVFAEDHLENVSKEIMLVQKCRQIHGNLKTKAKKMMKRPGEHLPMVAMARTNMSHFIKYKSKHMINGNA